jgi:hypothetical protein
MKKFIYLLFAIPFIVNAQSFSCDNIINTNYTITEKDSMSINQPSLIQDLENGLYIIEKNYNDGEQEQNTILKINNND